MFRLIAVTLVSAYALLAVTGPGPTVAPQQDTGLGFAQAPAPRLQVGQIYRVRTSVSLRHAADPMALAAGPLATGASVVVVATTAQGYAQVRDADGRTGYVPAAALTTAL